MSQSGDVLERFAEVLVQQITATRAEYLNAPFTVAEIYQDLVPYRSHRNLIGVEMNGDYEDALLRMLSGEGDYLVLDSEVARREMQAELASPNPDTGLFHQFAAVDVRLHPSRVPVAASTRPEVQAEPSKADTNEAEVAQTRAEKPEAEPEAEVQAVGASAEPVAADPGEAEPVGPSRPEPGRSSEEGVVGHIETASAPPLASVEAAVPDEPDSSHAETGVVMTVCHWCREDLPVRDHIHFCPFCGSDLRPSPCRECGEVMETRWQFCVSCGADVRG
jgi:hypothetical protein